MYVNRKNVKVIYDENGERVALYKCPFQYRRYQPNLGKTTPTASSKEWDEHGVRYCKYGKGSWCKNCMHYKQWKVSNPKFKRIIRRIRREGKAPQFWFSLSPQRLWRLKKLVNPI